MWHIGRLKMRLVGKSFPDNAVQYMAENAVPGPTYNVYEWGGYLIWQRWPERRVFIDGRCLVYGDEVIEESFRVAKGKKGWEDVLDRYEVMSVLLRYDKYKSDHFFEQGQWECIYWDDTALVAVKSGMAERLPRYNVTNPVTFSDALQENPPQIILEELDAVLNLNPTSWRAWMFRAQVLHKQVKEGERVGQETAAAARTAARRAVKLSQSAEEAKGVLEDVERAISSQPVESTEQKD